MAKLTIKQIDEYLAGNPSADTLLAVKRYLIAERERRRKIKRNSGRPRKEDTVRRRQLREAQRRFQEKRKEDNDESLITDFGA